MKEKFKKILDYVAPAIFIIYFLYMLPLLTGFSYEN